MKYDFEQEQNNLSKKDQISIKLKMRSKWQLYQNKFIKYSIILVLIVILVIFVISKIFLFNKQKDKNIQNKIFKKINQIPLKNSQKLENDKIIEKKLFEKKDKIIDKQLFEKKDKIIDKQLFEKKDKIIDKQLYEKKEQQQKIQVLPQINKIQKNKEIINQKGKQQFMSRKHGNLIRKNIYSQLINNCIQRIKLKHLPLNCLQAKQEHKYFQQKYSIDSYKQLPICVVIPSYNNVKNNRHYQNMASILQQNYTNYKVIFIDDASPDQTGIQIQAYLKQHDVNNKVTVKINSKNQLALQNLKWAAFNFCKPQDIFIIVDGDDQLIGKQVFKLYNAMFTYHKVWVFYTNFLSKRTQKAGFSRKFPQHIIKTNSYRKSSFSISHLRAFYTKLFLLIDDKDLRDHDGNYFKVAYDVAIYLPVLEMSHEKVLFIPQLMYLYNDATGLNDHTRRKKSQRKTEKYIRSFKSYQPVKKLFQESQTIIDQKLS